MKNFFFYYFDDSKPTHSLELATLKKTVIRCQNITFIIHAYYHLNV